MEITIQGQPFDVPLPSWIDVGQPITENIHASLAQTFCENVRNNQAAKWKKNYNLENGAALPEDKHAECQEAVNTYAASYEFGVRTGGGRGPSMDPETRLAIEEAEAAIVMGLKGQGQVAPKGKVLRELAHEVLAGPQGERFRALAKRRLRATKEAAELVLAGLKAAAE